MFTLVVKVSISLVLFGLYMMAATSLLSWMNIPNSLILVGCAVGLVVSTALSGRLFAFIWCRKPRKGAIAENESDV